GIGLVRFGAGAAPFLAGWFVSVVGDGQFREKERLAKTSGAGTRAVQGGDTTGERIVGGPNFTNRRADADRRPRRIGGVMTHVVAERVDAEIGARGLIIGNGTAR